MERYEAGHGRGPSRSPSAAGAASRRTRWSAPSCCLPTGEVLGEGWHEGPGTRPRRGDGAAGRGDRPPRGATVVVHARAVRPLRPHPSVHARADRRRASRRVVVAATDPEPRARARPGSPSCAAAGIEVRRRACWRPRRAGSTRRSRRHVRTGPALRDLKSAASLDGKTAAADGSSRWITVAGGARRRPAPPGVGRRDRRRVADRARRRPRAHRARRGRARTPARRCASSSTRAGRVPATARLFDGVAPTLVATTDRAPEDGDRGVGAPPAPRWPCCRATDAGGVSLAALLDAPGQARRPGRCSSRAVPRSRGPSSATTSSTGSSLYLAPVARGRRRRARGRSTGGGFAPIAGRAAPGRSTASTRVGPDLRVEADVHRDR